MLSCHKSDGKQKSEIWPRGHGSAGTSYDVPQQATIQKTFAFGSQTINTVCDPRWRILRILMGVRRRKPSLCTLLEALREHPET